MAIIVLQVTRGLFPQQWLILDYTQRLAALAIQAFSPRLRGLMALEKPRWVDLPLTMGLLEQRLRPVATVAVASLIFAANHWSQHSGAIVSAGLIHVPFVLAYLWRRSLLPLAVAH